MTLFPCVAGSERKQSVRSGFLNQKVYKKCDSRFFADVRSASSHMSNDSGTNELPSCSGGAGGGTMK